ncbi:MAG: hypothetical protein HOV67_10560 [Kribbellaceae bacterium]|nr:hypothetical protein [Kribbellaceae bacterium]
MSKTRQISNTLPEDLIDTIKAAVERGEARSVSSYIASRLAPGVLMDSLFAECNADRGAPSDSDRAWAERELDRAFAEQADKAPGHTARREQGTRPECRRVDRRRAPLTPALERTGAGSLCAVQSVPPASMHRPGKRASTGSSPASSPTASSVLERTTNAQVEDTIVELSILGRRMDELV